MWRALAAVSAKVTNWLSQLRWLEQRELYASLDDQRIYDFAGVATSAFASFLIGFSITIPALFTTSVGVPLRPYVLWLRLQCGAGELARGKSVADAAHATGFSDAAHFTRTFRRMIGATPRQVLQRRFAARDFHLND